MLEGGAPVRARRAVAGAAAISLVLAGGGLLEVGGVRAGASSPPATSVARSAVPAGFEPASVHFVSAERGFVLGRAPCGQSSCAALVATSDGGRSWSVLAAPPVSLATGQAAAGDPAAVGQVTFADASDGFAYGPGLWSTHDGGARWQEVRLGGPVVALAASAGFAEAVVASCDPSSPSCALPALRLERSPVARDDWRLVTGVAGYGDALLAVRGLAGWVATSPRRPFSAPWSIWHTTDAGASWRAIPDRCYQPTQASDLAGLASPGSSLLFELCAGNPGAGQEGKEVLVSRDGGASVALAGRPPLGGLASGIAAGGPDDLVVVASSGASSLYHSADGGRTWSTTMLDDGGAGLSDLAFVTSTEGAVIEGRPGEAPFPDRLLMTHDGGATWLAVTVAPIAAPAGPGAVWHEARRDQGAAARACIFSSRPGSGASGVRRCIGRFMEAHSASAAAVGFFDATGAYLIGFAPAGHLALGYTLTAQPMDCGCLGAMVLNGAPQYLLPPQPSLASPAYAALRRAYRLAGGATGLTYLFAPPYLEAERSLAGGAERLVLQYPLNDVCSACATPYRARVALRFSASGALVASTALGPCLGPAPQGSAAQEVGVVEPACPSTRAGPPQ